MTEVINITIKDKDIKLSLPKGESFFRILIERDLFRDNYCGGIGKCGRCKVRYMNHPPLPLPAERKLLSPEELRSGMRLACISKPVKDCEIELCFSETPKMDVISSNSFENYASAMDNATENGIENETENGLENGIYDETEKDDNNQIILVDLGTTTIAMLLVEKKSGKILKQYSCVNPQRKYGSDVITRISAGIGDEKVKAEMSELVLDEIGRGVKELGGNPQFMALAGNTTMIYILMGWDLTQLSREPFTPGNRSEIVTGIAGLKTYIMPGISAFVGGDISAGIYSILKPRAAFDKEKDCELLIDLGTNGEIALIKENDIYVTATAAGPAFEGRVKLWGSDFIKLVWELRKKQIIDEYGTFIEQYLQTGFCMEHEKEEVHITQDDIRALQLAKAAICAGVKILCKQTKTDLKEIEQIHIAGGFGHYLNVNIASEIGLFPYELSQKARATGNTVLAGLFAKYREYDVSGNDAVTQTQHIHMDKIFRAKAYNLAKIPDFEEEYIHCMNLRKI